MRALGLAIVALVVSVSSVARTDERVTVTGCPTVGVESGCLVITDKATGKTYDITSLQKGSDKLDPAKNLVIELTGTPQESAASFCMQGTILADIEWKYTDVTCPEDGD